MNHRELPWIAALALAAGIPLAGCGDDLRPLATSDDAPDPSTPDDPTTPVTDPPAQRAVYPVTPFVNVDNPGNDPLEPGSFSPVVSNSVAHARYAIDTMRLDDPLRRSDEDYLRAALAEIATSSGLTPLAILGHYAVTATEEEFAAFKAESEAEARGADPDRRLATAGRRLVTTRKQLDACVAAADDSGPATRQDEAAIACCRALAYPAMLIREWSRLSTDEQDGILADAAVDGFYDRFTAPSVGDPPSFRTQGTKAWLEVCEPLFMDKPATLAALKTVIGDYHDGTWDTELHPISMAKMAGRRIYRKNGVSVAESLAADCTVRDTEIVRTRDDAAMEFFSYNRDGTLAPYGYFPTGLVDVDAVKYTPDSCMGCHFTLDTRRFRVPIPSFRALNLRLRRDRDDAPLWRDDIACKQDGDVVVLHAEPPPPAQ